LDVNARRLVPTLHIRNGRMALKDNNSL